MPKDKDRSVNPAQQQRKLEKAKALKKGKAELQARRNEKLARRNPDRLQRQIDDLKALEQSESIKPREKQILEELEKDLRAVRRAREALGEKTPQYGNKAGPARRESGEDRGQGAGLGKRKWAEEHKRAWEQNDEQKSGSETDESVRRIPMPRDTPPPIRPRRSDGGKGTSANTEPLGGRRLAERQPDQLPAITVIAQAQTTYESAPQIRDLRKEAIDRFVPNVVRKKQDAIKGTGGLVEPEELDKLEREGYTGQESHHLRSAVVQPEASTFLSEKIVHASSVEETEQEIRRLAEEEERFQRDVRNVEMEEVQDEDL